ncbi:IS1096 element passenger TnpR family protein [Weissella cibaria]|uniref:Plasmid pRiA4b Orf3-like domain-containing protein n=1 Tax=Weissella cibaria TaxID=137591 RepID=A0A2S1KSH0_9LACO|nr:hypothetical protein [Weissella cibaria]AWF95883.1 hypothetical protein B6254_1489 [Weissella cibaria]
MIIKATLADPALPEISRLIRIPEFRQMAQLHKALQLAFGLTDSHLYKFDGGIYYITNDKLGIADNKLKQKQQLKHWDELSQFEQQPDLRHKTLKMPAVLLMDFFSNLTHATYVYDFGDDWRFDIEVVDMEDPYEENPAIKVLDVQGPDLLEDGHIEFPALVMAAYEEPETILDGSAQLAFTTPETANYKLFLAKLYDYSY